MMKSILIIAMILTVSITAQAQNYSLERMVLCTGGGVSTIGSYINRGVIGQTVSGTSSRGSFVNSVGFWGFLDYSTQVVEERQMPDKFELAQNYPNPFNPATNFEFSIPQDCRVKLEIYNILGQRVATVLDDNLSAGDYKVNWKSDGFASGVYLYRLIAGEYEITRKLTILE